MEHLIPLFLRPAFLHARLILAFWLMIYALVIFQDYLYAAFRSTGFYWSEVTLFNGYWLLFIPFSLAIKKWRPREGWSHNPVGFKALGLVVFGLLMSGLHILTFASFITLISNVCFTPAHPYLSTLSASISNDFAITLLVYLLISYAFLYLQPATAVSAVDKSTSCGNTRFLTVKQRNRQIRVEVASIQCFRASKPYTELYTDNTKYLLPQSLTSLEQSLDPLQFMRVHRAAIVNKAFIKTLISRKNGDYDVILKNDQQLRLSRHYRSRWSPLIAPST